MRGSPYIGGSPTTSAHVQRRLPRAPMGWFASDVRPKSCVMGSRGGPRRDARPAVGRCSGRRPGGLLRAELLLQGHHQRRRALPQEERREDRALDDELVEHRALVGKLPLVRGRRRGRRPRRPGHPGSARHVGIAGLGGELRHHSADQHAEAARRLEGVPRRGDQAIRPGWRLLDRCLPDTASRQDTAADQHLADLERSQSEECDEPPDPLYLREVADPLSCGDQADGPEGEGDVLGPAEPSTEWIHRLDLPP